MNLLLGTTNPAKVARLTWMLAGLPIDIYGAAGTEPTAEEGDRSVSENAEAKAVAWATTADMAALATDGGLEVPGLGPLWRAATTRRAAGLGATDRDRAEHLLRLAEGLTDRTAYIVEGAAMALPDGSVVGVWESRTRALQLADSYDDRNLPDGFWLPGVLLYGPNLTRYADLPEDELYLAEEHWDGLRDSVCEAVMRFSGPV